MARKRKPKQFEPVSVTWLDASRWNEQQKADKLTEVYKPCIRKTIGWYIGETDDVLLVATEDDRNANLGEDDCDGINAIPHGMIRTLVILEEPES